MTRTLVFASEVQVGVNLCALKFLLVRSRIRPLGRALEIGRQKRMPAKYRPAFERIMRAHGLGDHASDVWAETYTERLFEVMGATSVDSLDVSDFEGPPLYMT